MFRVILPRLNDMFAPLVRSDRGIAVGERPVRRSIATPFQPVHETTQQPLAHDKTVEQKYAFSMCVEHKLRYWLDTFLRPDAEYDRGLITSIYFDTPTLDLYDEKRNSDYLKTKVRLRWYGAIDRDQAGPVPCFLEVKRKFGAIRDKQRLPVNLRAAVLLDDPFMHPDILQVPRLLDEHGLGSGHDLAPLMMIRYERRRYVDSETEARIALDTNISCPLARPLPVSAGSVTLPVGVLEVKSRYRQLPPVLRDIGGDLRKEAFSKYALCYETLTQPLGRNV